jgi:hypothetical protein
MDCSTSELRIVPVPQVQDVIHGFHALVSRDALERNQRAFPPVRTPPKPL